jgi:hypothetical protein
MPLQLPLHLQTFLHTRRTKDLLRALAENIGLLLQQLSGFAMLDIVLSLDKCHVSYATGQTKFVSIISVTRAGLLVNWYPAHSLVTALVVCSSCCNNPAKLTYKPELATCCK